MYVTKKYDFLFCSIILSPSFFSRFRVFNLRLSSFQIPRMLNYIRWNLHFFPRHSKRKGPRKRNISTFSRISAEIWFKKYLPQDQFDWRRSVRTFRMTRLIIIKCYIAWHFHRFSFFSYKPPLGLFLTILSVFA